MSIQVRQTPNPDARKFVLPMQWFDRSMNFSDQESARQMPLAGALFALQGVYNVLLAQDFVTVNKLPAVEWPELEQRVISVLERWVAEQSGKEIHQSQRTKE